ncbi:hypothetical protein GCM10028803_59830 [Larkinella knui]|uniref:Peptidase C-terminal archaeal/bacterial domain-containing protein n=1 Tax=Larkinella knui TaxID=2025310 RepID=A0A3P1CB85_9BACT|nr:hypothetical protein [Larkinella knui]RRB10326.1 hypothetical protein EHT87_29305 [Larkinella knui]
MKDLLVLVLLTAALLVGCKKEEKVDPAPDPVLTPQKVTGSWVAAQGGGGGFNNFDSFKNYQFNFEVKDANQDVLVELISPTINVQYALFDPLGQRMDASGQERSLSRLYKQLGAGKYRVVVTADRRAVGNFELTMLGVNGKPVPIPFATLQTGTQNWGKLGGGGTEFTFKNHFYTVDVTEDNTTVDIELLSADTDISLYVYDGLGQRVAYTSGGRYKYILQATRKGSYTVTAGTQNRGDVGDYQLNLFGKVANLKRIESQVTTVTGKWDTSSPTSTLFPYEPYNTYSLQLTATNSPLDVELSSPDINVDIRLQTSVGNQIAYATSGTRKSIYLVAEKVAQGSYRIKVSAYRKEYGNYTLTVHGQFADLKKI